MLTEGFVAPPNWISISKLLAKMDGIQTPFALNMKPAKKAAACLGRPHPAPPGNEQQRATFRNCISTVATESVLRKLALLGDFQIGCHNKEREKTHLTFSSREPSPKDFPTEG